MRCVRCGQFLSPGNPLHVCPDEALRRKNECLVPHCRNPREPVSFFYCRQHEWEKVAGRYKADRERV